MAKKLINTVVKIATGVILNGIIEEYGTNYIKLENGLMFQWGDVSALTVFNSAFDGKNFYTVDLGNFPIAFKSIYSCNRSFVGATHLYYLGGYSNYSNNSLGAARLIHSSPNMASNSIRYSYIAIGKWK